MAIANKIPSVLFQPHGNSLSIERVLKSAIELLDEVTFDSDSKRDRVLMTQSDLEDMLKALDRG